MVYSSLESQSVQLRYFTNKITGRVQLLSCQRIQHRTLEPNSRHFSRPKSSANTDDDRFTSGG